MLSNRSSVAAITVPAKEQPRALLISSHIFAGMPIIGEINSATIESSSQLSIFSRLYLLISG